MQETEPISDPRQTIGAIAKPLGAVADIVTRNEKAAAESAAREAYQLADTEISNQTAVLLGEGQKMLGADARRAPAEVLNKFNEVSGKVAERYRGTPVEGAIQRSIQSNQSTLFRAMVNHANKEAEREAETNYEAALQEARNVVNLAADDPTEVMKQREKTTALVGDRLKTLGIPAVGEDQAPNAAHKQATTEAVSSTWTSAVAGALGKRRPDLAKMYAEAAEKKGELTEADRQRMSRLMDQYQKQEEEINYKRATDLVDQNPGINPKNLVPKNVWESLDTSARAALETRAEAPGFNNGRKWLDFLDLTPESMAKMSRADFEKNYWMHFDREHRGRAESMWTRATQKGPAAAGKDPVLTSSLTFREQIENTLRVSGAIPAKKNRPAMTEKDVRYWDDFENRAAAALEEFEMNKLGGQRKATQDERQQVIDRLMIQKAMVGKSGFDQEKPIEQLTPAEMGKAYIPMKKIPPGDVENIKVEFKKRWGNEPDEREIEHEYFLSREIKHTPLEKIPLSEIEPLRTRMTKLMDHIPDDNELERAYFALNTGNLALYRKIVGIKK